MRVILIDLVKWISNKKIQSGTKKIELIVNN